MSAPIYDVKRSFPFDRPSRFVHSYQLQFEDEHLNILSITNVSDCPNKAAVMREARNLLGKVPAGDRRRVSVWQGSLYIAEIANFEGA